MVVPPQRGVERQGEEPKITIALMTPGAIDRRYLVSHARAITA